MISEINELPSSNKGRIAKVLIFPGAKVDDMKDLIKPLLKKAPDVILHIGTNNTTWSPLRIVSDKLLLLKYFIEKDSSSEKSLSNLIQRIDNEKATLVITIIGITTTHREHWL